MGSFFQYRWTLVRIYNFWGNLFVSSQVLGGRLEPAKLENEVKTLRRNACPRLCCIIFRKPRVPEDHYVGAEPFGVGSGIFMTRIPFIRFDEQ